MDARQAAQNQNQNQNQKQNQNQNGGHDQGQGQNRDGSQGRDLSTEFEALKKDLGQVRKDLQNLADAGFETAKGTRDRFDSETRQMIDRMRDASSSAMEREQDMMQDVRRRVGDKPITSIVTALGVGFVVGWLASK